MFSYIAYGMHVVSEIPLQLPIWDGIPRQILRIMVGDSLNSHEGLATVYGNIRYWVDPTLESVYVKIGSSLRASIKKGADIIVDFSDKLSEQLVSSGVVSIVLTLWVKLHGYHTFHGSAVCSAGHQGVMFLGDQGSGKSTTAAYLTKSGFRLLCDDVVPISLQDNVPIISSGISWAKLLPDALRLFDVEEEDLAHQFDGFDKYALSVSDMHSTVPLTACFVIEKSVQPHPYFCIERVYGMKKVKLMCSHSSQLLGIDSQQAVFNFISNSLSKIPMWKVVRDPHNSSLEAISQALNIIFTSMEKPTDVW